MSIINNFTTISARWKNPNHFHPSSHCRVSMLRFYVPFHFREYNLILSSAFQLLSFYTADSYPETLQYFLCLWSYRHGISNFRSVLGFSRVFVPVTWFRLVSL